MKHLGIDRRRGSYALGLFILAFLGISYAAAEAYDWRTGVLVFVALVAIWEFAFRAASRA